MNVPSSQGCVRWTPLGQPSGPLHGPLVMVCHLFQHNSPPQVLSWRNSYHSMPHACWVLGGHCKTSCIDSVKPLKAVGFYNYQDTRRQHRASVMVLNS